MPPQLAEERRLQHRAEARRAILDAAEDLLVEGGLDAFSMRRLAERCGYTAPTIYHYFRDKPGLVAELLEERLGELVGELRQVPVSGNAVDDLRAFAAAFAGWGLRHPNHYQLLLTTRGDDLPEPPSSAEVERLLVEPIDILARDGELSEADRQTLRQGLWSLLHGLILLQTTRPEEPWEPDLLERSLDAMIRGSLGRVAAEARR